MPYAVDAIRELGEAAPDLPVFGICLGHQLMARAQGGDTYKLPFGHHGGNHPVRNAAAASNSGLPGEGMAHRCHSASDSRAVSALPNP